MMASEAYVPPRNRAPELLADNVLDLESKESNSLKSITEKDDSSGSSEYSESINDDL